MPESGDFSEGLAVVEKNGKMGYIDKTGKIVIEPKYDAAYPFIDGRAAVQIEFKAGFIDRTGRETIPMIYEPSSRHPSKKTQKYRRSARKSVENLKELSANF